MNESSSFIFLGNGKTRHDFVNNSKWSVCGMMHVSDAKARPSPKKLPYCRTCHRRDICSRRYRCCERCGVATYNAAVLLKMNDAGIILAATADTDLEDCEPYCKPCAAIVVGKRWDDKTAWPEPERIEVAQVGARVSVRTTSGGGFESNRRSH